MSIKKLLLCMFLALGVCSAVSALADAAIEEYWNYAWQCGDAKPSQGPLEPGALHAELCLGGQGTAEEPCCCPSLPSDRAFTAGALGSVQPTSP